MSLFGIFGGDKKTTQTTSNVQNADMRTAVGGSVGSLVSPGAAVAGGGAINAAPGSTVSQSIVSTGLSANDVGSMMTLLQQDRAGERQAVTAMAESAAAGMRAQASQVSEILAATKSPDSNTINQLLPVFILLALLFFVTR